MSPACDGREAGAVFRGAREEVNEIGHIEWPKARYAIRYS